MPRWWNRLWQQRETFASEEEIKSLNPNLPGWHECNTEDKNKDELRVWHDPAGDGVLSLAVKVPALGLASMPEAELRCWCRNLAEGRGGGLIEARRVSTWIEPAVALIYKRLVKPAYVFTGMFIASFKETSLIWTIVDGERGTTGVREAVVTAQLMNAGKLTVESYQHSWARDPYDPDYSGVDRSVLRFTSDDEYYDMQFPGHPLSRVRRVLAALPTTIEFRGHQGRAVSTGWTQ